MSKIKVIESIETEKNGKLPEELIGGVYDVVKVDDEGTWIYTLGAYTLLLDGEFVIVDENNTEQKFEITGKVVEREDTSRYGVYYDVSNDNEDLTHLLEKFHGKKVKVTVEALQ